MKNSFLLLFLCLPFWAGRELAAQTNHDSLQEIAGKYYRLTDLKMSEDGRWITIRKSYDLNSDTVLIFDSRNSEQPVCYRTKANNIVFLSNDNLLMQGPEKAELLNPKEQTSIYFDGVKQIRAVKNNSQFLLHYNEAEKNSLELRDRSGGLLNTTDHVSRFYINKSDHIFAITEKESGISEVVVLKDKNTETAYVSHVKVSKLEPDPGGHGIMVYEQNQDNNTQEVLYNDLLTGNTFLLKDILPASIQNGFREVISEGSIYFMKLLVHVKKEDTSLVDVWYGNDNKLEEKFCPPARELCYVWEPVKKVIQQIGNDQMPTGVNLGNSLYFLSFNKYLFNDYICYVPDLKICLYNRQINTYATVDTIQPELYPSQNGEYFLYKKKSDWCLYNCLTGVKRIIPDERLNRPYFSADGKSVMFDGEGGLRRYSIERDDMIRSDDFTGYEATILNGSSESVNIFRFYRNTVSDKQPLVIKLCNPTENENTHLLWKNGRYDTIVPLTSKRIQNLVYNNSYSHFCYTEEDYNLPPRLVYKKRGEDEKVLYQSNKTDTAILLLKQEIIQYTNSDCVPLKGVLYYPLNYNPSGIYPMVVHIYQVQSKKISNEYPTISYSQANNNGFDLRLLLEKGYFVYFPDIVYGEMGTGLSALDCVNHALDALGNNTSIDRNKIGLIGHSHGGYETNFITTHSNRFAAYVSGAGNSDIVRSYFSFNYNFRSPFYWQYETGQYEINKSFSEAKDLYFQNNPIHYVDQVNAPVLLWTGMKDRNIYWEQTMEFYTGLKRNNKQVIALFYPDEGHTLFNPEACRDLVSRILEWFDYFLKGERDTNWIN